MALPKTTTLRPPRSIVARVRAFVRDHALIERGERVLAGVSGGPDSTCLLLTLASLRRSLGIDIVAAHFDHRLRGPRASERERRAVRSLCDALDLPLRSGGGDVRAHARARGRSIEEAARELRYRFFAQVAARNGCAVVAVGHTRDDQTETVLLRLLRGSGLRGLAGMAPDAGWPVSRKSRAAPPRLVRPLLALSRADAERCCGAAGLTPLRDPSNRSRAHLRNRIRHELLPLLRRYNPKVDGALVRLADAASSDVDLLEQLAADAVLVHTDAPDVVRLSRRRLAALPPALRRHAVRLAAARVLGDRRGLGERHVRAVLRAAERSTGARLDLPRGLHVEVRREDILLATGARTKTRPLPNGRVPLPVPGAARIGGWRVEVEVVGPLGNSPRAYARPDLALLDADACGDALWLRRRRDGDRFQPLGLRSAKKLQDFLVDAHVPRSERDELPLLCAGPGIAWVVGQRPAEWAKVTPSTRRVLRVLACGP